MADTTLILLQVAFIVFIALLAFGAGILPGVVPWCKKSTEFLGIANAFSGGVFLAIAFMHIMPEVASGYAEYMEHDEHEESWLRHGDDEDDYFPLPFALAFGGYAFILLIDKVIFDTHSLVGEHHGGHTHDPAQQQFAGNVKNSFLQFQRMVSGEQNV
jgi:zinc transporter ZupT